MENQDLTAAQFNVLVNRRSGLLGVSGVSSDMHTLLEQSQDRAEAAEAIDMFCYHARKFLGGYAAALGGLDTIVFTGGIGENASPVRRPDFRRDSTISGFGSTRLATLLMPTSFPATIAAWSCASSRPTKIG